jgi:hypothetical protein
MISAVVAGAVVVSVVAKIGCMATATASTRLLLCVRMLALEQQVHFHVKDGEHLVGVGGEEPVQLGIVLEHVLAVKLEHKRGLFHLRNE